MYVYKTILGMDKLPSYDGFAVVIIVESEILAKKDIATLNDIVEMVEKYRIDAIAIDNIYEIGSEYEIRRFAGRFYRTDLIQVTGSPSSGFAPLSSIGRQMGFSSGEKLNPVRSAEVCARAAIAGAGFTVKMYDPETKISILKRRKFGTGGMSEGRYRRSIEGAVLNLTGRIKRSLNSKKIDYDLAFKKGAHGIDSASFTAYAPRNALFGVVRPLRTSSINVRISPTFTKSFEFLHQGAENERRAAKRYLIVGVDPGMVTGLAVIDLNGKVLHLSSGRGITRGQITRTLAGLGRALIFSADVNPPPEMINKLGAMHNASIYYPEKSLKTFEKSELANRVAEEQRIKVDDTHQRDSLSAAIKTFSFYRNKLEQCVSHAREQAQPVQIDEVKALVLRGMSIKDAIAKSQAPVVEPILPPKKRHGSERQIIKVLEAKYDDMRAERDALFERVKERDEKIEDLENSIRLARLGSLPKKTSEVYELERRIHVLLGEVASLRGQLDLQRSESLRLASLIVKLVSGTSIALCPISELTKEALRTIKPVGGNKIAFIERMEKLDDAAALDVVRSSDLTALLVHDQPPAELVSKVSDIGVPLLLLHSLSYELCRRMAIVDRESFEKALESAKKELVEIRNKNPKKVLDLFEEYRKERQKETLRKA